MGILISQNLGKFRVRIGGGFWVDHMSLKRCKQLGWKYFGIEHRMQQPLKGILPLSSVGFSPESMGLMHPVVGYFVYIGDQKFKRVKVVVNRNVGMLALSAGEIPRLGDSFFGYPQQEGLFFPQA